MADDTDRGRWLFLPGRELTLAVDEPFRIHGLVIQPSQQAQDLLAAFHLGAQTVLATLSPMANQQQGQPGREVVVDYQGQDEDIYGEVTLPDLMGMDPLRREAMLSQFGLTVATPPASEPDPTAANLNQMLEADGIPTKPGPGGAIARPMSRYEPDDVSEEE